MKKIQSFQKSSHFLWKILPLSLSLANLILEITHFSLSFDLEKTKYCRIWGNFNIGQENFEAVN